MPIKGTESLQTREEELGFRIQALPSQSLFDTAMGIGLDSTNGRQWNVERQYIILALFLKVFALKQGFQD